MSVGVEIAHFSTGAIQNKSKFHPFIMTIIPIHMYAILENFQRVFLILTASMMVPLCFLDVPIESKRKREPDSVDCREKKGKVVPDSICLSYRNEPTNCLRFQITCRTS